MLEILQKLNITINDNPVCSFCYVQRRSRLCYYQDLNSVRIVSVDQAPDQNS